MTVPSHVVPHDAPSLEALRGAVDGMDALVALVDPDGRLVHVNRAWRVFAAEHGAAGTRAEAIVTGFATAADPASIHAGVRDVVRGRAESFEAEYPCPLPAATRWFAMRATPMAVDGVGAVLLHTDVTGRHLAAAEAGERAAREGATGLANRRRLEHRLDELLQAGPVGIVALRVHGPGRPATGSFADGAFVPGPFAAGGGEDAVRATAALLARLVPTPDIAGRHGVDAFVVLLPGADDETLRHGAMALAAGWRARVGRPAGLDATIGTVHAAPGDDAHEALERAAAEAAHVGPAPFPTVRRLTPSRDPRDRRTDRRGPLPRAGDGPGLGLGPAASRP